MDESNKNKKCLSVISEFCLLSVVYSLCIDLKYLLEVWYIILVYLKVARFLEYYPKSFYRGPIFDFRDTLFEMSEKISQKLTAFEFSSI